MAYRILEHTADVGIEVTAGDLDELFCECLRGLTDCLTRLRSVGTGQTRKVHLLAPDLARLLVEFLEEAIYLHETTGLVFADARVAVVEAEDGWQLDGELAGEPFDLDRHGLRTLVKAVTFHQLSVELQGDRWIARVIFDI